MTYSEQPRSRIKKTSGFTLMVNLLAFNLVLAGAPDDPSASVNEMPNNSIDVMDVMVQRTVTGKVTDENGVGLPGAAIIEMGTGNGTTSDFDGNYNITVQEGATISISYIGYSTEQIVVGDQTVIDVQMSLDAAQLDDVIVVGYGTQKKANLTGAVGTLDVDNFQGRPITQTSQILTGEIAGVSVRQGIGEPGRDQANIVIRGLGTFSDAGTNPLILIDGVPGNMNWINPNDIKSVNVLKDAASAAIYGSRGANGVILIETKQGAEGGFQVEYDTYVGWARPTEWPDFVNSWEYAEALNEARTNEGNQPRYTQEEIDLFRAGTDPINYPNVPHFRQYFSSGSGFQNGHSVTISGGNERNRMLFSLGFIDNNGFVKKNYNRRYNVRFNSNTKITDRLELDFKIAGSYEKDHKPGATLDNFVTATNGGVTAEVAIYGAGWLNATIPGRLPDGTYGNLFRASPLAGLDSDARREGIEHNILTNAVLRYKLLNSLTVSAEAAYTYNQRRQNDFFGSFDVNENFVLDIEKLNERYNNTEDLLVRSVLEFKEDFGDHNVLALAGFEQQRFERNWINGYRENFPNNQLTKLNAGDESTQTNASDGTAWALRSYFGRTQYNYKEKYLLEANFRYDGSSRFASDNRWGFFPSFSAAWRISEEDFFPKDSWINQFKIRASWGQLGNQNIGLYPYQSTLVTGQNYVTGGGIRPGARVTQLANEDVSWETTTGKNIAIDLGMFDGKLALSADLFERTTDDILYNISTVDILGLNPSEVNAGEVQNKGFELELSHQNRINNFSYSISSNFTYLQNEVKRLDIVERDINAGLFVGEPLGSYYGFQHDGVFLDQADIDSYPTQPYNAFPGNPRYMDISGPDGVPDGVVDAEHDRKVLASTQPKYLYAATLNADYKGIFMTVQLQGEGGMQREVYGQVGSAFYNLGNIQRYQLEGAWDPDNPTRYPSYPRLEERTNGKYFGRQRSTLWLREASFLRIRNLQLGYNFPQNFVEAVGLKSARIFGNVTNLVTFDNYPVGWDPDQNYSRSWFWGIRYPLSRTLTFGLNVRF